MAFNHISFQKRKQGSNNYSQCTAVKLAHNLDDEGDQ